MHICVTGGAGYVGSALVPILDDVRVVDDLSVGEARNLPEGCDLLAIRYESIPYSDYDAVIHLAAAVGEKACDNLPQAAIARNVNGLVEMLRSMKMLDNPRHIVFASSLVVYGDGPAPFVEDQPHKPLNVYAMTKCMGELLLGFSGLPHTILRFSNVYGLGKICRRESLTGKFARCAAEGKPLPIWGDGLQRVDMVHVRDVARACRHFAENRIQGTYNIGSGEAENVLSVASWFGVDAEYPLPDYKIPHDRTVVTKKARAAGWFAIESPIDAAEELVEYARNRA